MPDRRHLLVAAGSLIVSAITTMIAEEPEAVAAWGFLVATSLVLALPTSGGRRRSAVPVVLAAAAAVGAPVAVVFAALGWGVPVGWLVARIGLGERTGDDLARTVAVGGAAFVATLGAGEAFVPHEADASLVHLLLALSAGGAWFVAAAVDQGRRIGRLRQTSRRVAVRQEMGAWPVHLAMLAAGSLYGVAEPGVRGLAVLLAALPYTFLHLSMHRLERARLTYRQTIEVLGRIPEAGGYAAPGRARRTADLARAVAAELGMRQKEIETAEQAALLHEVGRVVLNDPSIASSAFSDLDLAVWGAAIVGESPVLEPVAAVIAAHPEPYRSPGEGASADVPREARILRAVRAFDDARGEGSSTPEALDVLHQRMAYDFDPEVVNALRSVMRRRGLVTD